MARTQSIDRTRLLTIAEEIILEHGASGLTISALADSAGISKGGVQSCFATKELLIRSLLERWFQSEESSFQQELETGATLSERILAHARVTRRDGFSSSKSTRILIALLQEPSCLELVQDWYRKRISGLDKTFTSNPNVLIAFLAIEGAWYLHSLGVHKMGLKMWDRAFDEIEKILNRRQEYFPGHDEFL